MELARFAPIQNQSGGASMKTIRRLIYGEIIVAVAFVTLCFLGLFTFFDLIDEIAAVGKTGPNGYQLRHALAYVALLAPNRIYELLPITILIGTVFVMARLAQSSEYTILRTSGLGPWRALHMLINLGLALTLLTFLIGDYLAPAADRTAQLLKARYSGSISVGQTGAWLKDKQTHGSYAVNVGAMSGLGTMKNVRIFEFDNAGYVVSTLHAQSGEFGDADEWVLHQVERTQFGNITQEPGAINPRPALLEKQTLAQYRWPSTLTPEMVTTALLRPDRMKTVDLFEYIRHLTNNGQTAQRYEIEFWRKVFYPLSSLVMVILALPFAYLHFRSGSTAGYIFMGVMTGISFFLLNNVFGFVGNLRNWEPWIAAGTPGLIYLMVSLSAFGWLVLRR
jgi:lipopolysaccharide export system permease protein